MVLGQDDLVIGPFLVNSPLDIWPLDFSFVLGQGVQNGPLGQINQSHGDAAAHGYQ